MSHLTQGHLSPGPHFSMGAVPQLIQLLPRRLSLSLGPGINFLSGSSPKAEKGLRRVTPSH